MNEDIIRDLKQFIVSTVAQSTADLQQGLAKVEDRVVKLESRIDRFSSDVELRFNDLEAKLETVADAHSETLAEYEIRLQRLEQGA